MDNTDDIAVIGLALKLPKANNIQMLDQVLRNKVCCVNKITEERKEMAELCQKILGYSNTGYMEGAYLENITSFDCKIFNLSPLEATVMDVNQRLFLETAVDAIEDAGYGADRLHGSNTGVYYAGSCKLDYLELIKKINPKLESIAEMGNLPSFAAGRLAFKYDLKGPAIYINTLCSSSLVALNMACKAIVDGECNMAIVGGSRVEILPLKKEAIGIESSDAHTRAFSDDANGTVGGEGCIVLLIKRLKLAHQDCDNIYAVIKGSAVNQDGHCSSLTSPNQLAQAEVIQMAWKNAKINPLEVGYIEAHGTGTKLGDPIEIAGLTEAYSKYNYDKQFCYIGSVKTNYGHLDCISGLLGVLKVILSVNKKIIYPQLFFNKPNRYIDFINSPIKVCTDLVEWSINKGNRICGVSSFGFSGTNCHMVIQEYDKISTNDGLMRYYECEERHFICLSSETHERLIILVKKYIELIENQKAINLRDLCYSANIRNSCYQERIIFSADTLNQLYDKMKHFTFENNSEECMNKDYYRRYFNNEVLKLLFDYIDGKNVNFKEFYRDVNYEIINVPLYPFIKRTLWISSLVKND